MTRTERLAAHAVTLQQQLEQDEAAWKQRAADQRKALEQVKAAQRAEQRKAREKRRAHVGKLVDDTGLLVWEDATLARLFQTLASLLDTPDPVAALEGLLTDPALLEIPEVLESEAGPDRPLWHLQTATIGKDRARTY